MRIQRIVSLIIAFAIAMGTAPVLKAEDLTSKSTSQSEGFFQNPDPDNAAWNDAAALKVDLMPQNITQPGIMKATVPSVTVKSLHNSEYVSIMLEWADATKDDLVDTDRASDACAVQFPVKAYSSTIPFMGNQGAPVVILHWKAIWNRDKEKGFQQVKDIHPNVYNETYMFGKSVATDAGNPISNQSRTSPVEEIHAEGFGTVTTSQDSKIFANGKWKDGKWRVVFSYRINPDVLPALKPGSSTAIALAVWSGSDKNVGGRKNYAPWKTLRIE